MSKLVITRRIGERLFIEEDIIKIDIVNIKGNQVRLAIEAPKEITIHREEVYNRIKAEKVEQLFDGLDVENDSIDEELMSQLMRKFGRCANDESVNGLKTN